MMQSLDRQLQVVLRALGDVVAPALAGADRHVVEQLQLSIATLSFVAKRLPDERRFQRWELAAYVALARDLPAGEGTALAAFVAAGEAELARPEADGAEIEATTRRGREAIAAFAEDDASPAVERLILDRSAAIIDQQRQWCAPFGFELQPETLAAPAW